MINLVKRSDSIYKEIEAFKDYELTNCIAYEMAIRNDNLRKIVKKFSNTFSLPRSSDDFTSDDYNKLITYMLEVKKEKRNEIKNTYCIDALDYFIYKAFKNSYLLRKEKKVTYKVDGSLRINKSILKALKEKGIENFESIFEVSIDFPLSRPKLYIPKVIDKNIKINVNLNLPKKELIAYISKVKDDYDKDNSIIKSPLELLGEDSEKSDNKYTQKKSNAEKYADWFYVYDCYQILKANNKKSNETIYNEIDLSLQEHYDSTKEDYYSIETYKKTIMKNMNYLINDLGYKELITGVKNN